MKKGTDAVDETMDGCLSCACTISTSVVRVYMLVVLMTRTCQCEAATNTMAQVQLPEPDVTRTAKCSSCVVVVCYQDHRDTCLLPSVSTNSADAFIWTMPLSLSCILYALIVFSSFSCWPLIHHTLSECFLSSLIFVVFNRDA